jgi:hypothetical protein
VGRDSILRGLAVLIAVHCWRCRRFGPQLQPDAARPIPEPSPAGAGLRFGPFRAGQCGQCGLRAVAAGRWGHGSVGHDHAAGRLVASGSALGPARGSWVSTCASGANRRLATTMLPAGYRHWRRGGCGGVAGELGASTLVAAPQRRGSRPAISHAAPIDGKAKGASIIAQDR